jgi:conjugative relaxase-like TrwC/TraI family protein
MLTVSKPMTVAKASHYFRGDDYYLSEKGEWQGRGAEALGLAGEIGNDDFKAVLRGLDPRSGETLVEEKTDRETGTAHRRGGIDLTFSAPKSVSVLALADGRVKGAHEAAVSAVVDYLERNHAHLREQAEGDREVISAGNLVVGKFTHMVSRAAGGEVLPDPQLHTHAFVVNLTQREDGAWRAHHNDALYRDQLVLGRFYRAELARNLRDLGYAVEVTEPGRFLWEVRGVPGEVLDEFSKRRQQIVERTEELRAAGEFPRAGDAALREIANSQTRLPKGRVSREELLEHWTASLREHGHTLNGLQRDALREGEKERSPEKGDARGWVATAAKLRTETESVFTRGEVLDLAVRLSRGEAGLRELDRAFTGLSEDGRLPFLGTVPQAGKGGAAIPRDVYTTRDMQAMERSVLDLVRESKGTYTPFVSRPEVAAVLVEKERAQGWRFTAGQVAAVRTILESRDRVNLVQGDAGTGKTASLALVRELAQQKGVTVLGLGFTGKAAQELQEGAGIPSKTLDSFLHAKGWEKLPPGSLLLLDEASMAGTRHFHRLLTAAEERNLKVAVVGDRKQFQSVAAGRNHALLQDLTNVDRVQMTEVIRQETDHAREVVDAASRGRTDRALEVLARGGNLRQVSDRDGRLDAVVQEYLALRDAKREVLILSATNADRAELNDRIRSALVAAGRLEPGRSFRVQEPTGMGPEEAALAGSYRTGERVLFLGDAGEGLGAGTQAEVVGRDLARNTLKVEAEGRTHEVPLLGHYDKIAVYRVAERSFAPGDRVVFLRNDEKLGVQNGLQGTVTHLDERGNVVVRTDARGGRPVRFRLTEPEARAKGDARYRYDTLTHAYAVTEYKGQGATTSAVIWYADTRRGRIHRNSFYVAATRARHDILVFTDDKERLKNLVRRPQEKSSTLDHLPDRLSDRLGKTFAWWRDRDRIDRGEGRQPEERTRAPEKAAPRGSESPTREKTLRPPERIREREMERER